MPLEQVVARLERRYPKLERLSNKIYRGIDVFEGRPYAVRYFDLSDDLLDTSVRIHEYQSELLGASYYNSESKADLRWNHYLYFVTSARHNDAFRKAKAAVESDREFARKIVVDEDELETVLDDKPSTVDSSSTLPPDAVTIWTRFLEEHHLAFIVDESLPLTEIARSIADGQRVPLVRPPTTPNLSAAEAAASSEFLAGIEIHEFRKYPIQRTFTFGDVNLIRGVNGVGKTSLFEAIEYLFCGKTRRAGAVSGANVSGVFATSKLTLQTRESTPQRNLRARNLAWYGKSEIKTLTLDDSFGKFNFLDTDAAFRLAAEKDSNRFFEDLAQLLLGAESAKALDRLGRVERQLQDSRKKLENEIALRESRRAEAADRIEQLRGAPLQSDALVADLNLVLREMGWVHAPIGKDQADRLTAPLQAALSNLRILKSAGDMLPESAGELKSFIDAAAGIESEIEKLSQDEVVRKQYESETRLQVLALNKRLEAIDALDPIVGSGIEQIHLKCDSLTRRIAELAPVLIEAESAVAGLTGVKGLQKKPISQALAELTQQVRTADERATMARVNLSALEQTQNVLRSLQQRLLASAREIITHTGDAKHCPLCNAEYSETELRKRFDAVAQGLEAEESDRLRSELQAAESLQQDRTSALRALQVLEKYTRPDAGSVDAAVMRVRQDRDAFDRDQAELDSARATLVAHAKEGWTFERLIELASVAGISETAITLEDLDSVRTAIRSDQKKLFDDMHASEAKGEVARARIDQIGIRYELRSPSVSELLQTVSGRRRGAEDKRKALVVLKELLAFKSQTATELVTLLQEAQDLNVRIRTAIAQEEQDSGAMVRESKILKDATAEVDAAHVKLARVDSAIDIIKELLTQQSEKILTQALLRENAAQIAAIFARIHAPNEFDLEANDGLTIVRRGSGEVELSEMSSGQRAAYALSLFLAMNGRLTTGPRVLLFDDPVAHVDDINTLSLLDHLRDIALSRRRQIFFATADSKIGALLARKFGFLGDRFKQIELARD